MTRDRNKPTPLGSPQSKGSPRIETPASHPSSTDEHPAAAKPQGRPANPTQAKPRPSPAAKPDAKTTENPSSLLSRLTPRKPTATPTSRPPASASNPQASASNNGSPKRPGGQPASAPTPAVPSMSPAAMTKPAKKPTEQPSATPAGVQKPTGVALPLPRPSAGTSSGHKHARSQSAGDKTGAGAGTAQVRPGPLPRPASIKGPAVKRSEPSTNNPNSTPTEAPSAQAQPASATPSTPHLKTDAPNQGLTPEPLTSYTDGASRKRTPASQQPELERQYLPTGTPRPRASLHEKSKAPSIGGLIHSMQAKPSKTPYYTAAITSVVWLFIGGLLGWLLVGQSLSDFSGYKAVLGTSSVYILAAAILVPIALFWFIAQLVVRSQEMKLMASAMTEVAIRLAEPDKMAEQKVSSVGQTIRRQVSAMDDAISRAIGRAGELEALVHNEVAALERSYSQNEFIIRNLLNELVNEREAIAHNGIQVKQTLQGVGAQVSKHIRQTTDSIGQNLAQHGTMSALKLQQAGDQVTQAIQTTTNQSVAIKQKISDELPQLLTKMNAEQRKLGGVIDVASKNLGQLDTTLAQRTTDIDSVISKHTGELNTRLQQKVKALDASLAMRTKSMDKVLTSKAGELDQTFLTHRDAIDTTMQQKAVEIDKAIATQATAMDASLTEKARTIDSAFDQRLANLNDIQPVAPAPAVQETPPALARKELSMLRGSEALERAMTSQTENMQASLQSNRDDLEQTIIKQNQLSPQISALTKKHDQLLSDHAAQLTHVRDQFDAQSADLSATARLLTNPDMKMSAMMGQQQNKARAILGDLVSRSAELEKSRLAQAQTLQNSLMICDETAEILKKQLFENASPRAQKAAQEVDQNTAHSVFSTQKLIRELEQKSTSLSQQIVETVSSMSRSSSRTKILPGEVASTSTDIKKAVDTQMQALDALAQISGTNIGSGLASATGTGSTSGPSSAMGQGPHGQSQAAMGQSGGMPPANAKDRSAPRGKRPSQWSFGDLLARVADTDGEHEEQPLPTYRPADSAKAGNNGARKSGLALDPLDILRVDDIARALDSHTAATAWNRSQSGERNVFTRGLYTSEGQITFDQISERYNNDENFHNTVEKYVIEFEGLLKEADEKDPSGRIIQNYLTVDAGRAYLMLAHISGRLG